jgi:hypothetical protein
MTNQHPITPPPELVEQWYDNMGPDSGPFESFAIAAARWGADQELEACCKWLPKLPPWSADDLRKHRRPKPPSLKEQALMALEDGDLGPGASLTPVEVCIIRRALEQLDD